jgi:integrase
VKPALGEAGRPRDLGAVLRWLDGPPASTAGLGYGVGLRLLECVRLRMHEIDLRDAPERKDPRVPWERGWQWASPTTRFDLDACSGRDRCHHLLEPARQQRFKSASRASGAAQAARCRSTRAATHPAQAGYNTRAGQELVGHGDVSIARICAHVLTLPAATPWRRPRGCCGSASIEVTGLFTSRQHVSNKSSLDPRDLLNGEVPT